MIKLSIQGMTCPSCAPKVHNKIIKLEGVLDVSVSYEESLVSITPSEDFNVQSAIDALESEGYQSHAQEDSCCASDQFVSNKKHLHVAIIGSGSGAFACATKAAEGGAKVTIIEGADVIGGCCVNVGCVPSKILIRAAQLAEQQRNNPFAGLENHQPQLNRALLSQQQSARVEELRHAKYQNILDTNPSLSLIKGYARFKNANTLIIDKPDGDQQEISADKILIATGSTPTIPAINGLSGTPYWTSTEALFATDLPEHLVVIGSSVVALEIAQAYRRLGSEVTVLARHTLLYREDPLLGEELEKCFKKEGIPYQGVEIDVLNERPYITQLLNLSEVFLNPQQTLAYFSLFRSALLGLDNKHLLAIHEFLLSRQAHCKSLLFDIFDEARIARNSIAHGLCKGLTGCIDTKVTDLEFIQMVQEVIKPIALADYWISYFLSKLNQEPLLQIKPENYQKKILNWVLDCNSEYWIPPPPYPYKI